MNKCLVSLLFLFSTVFVGKSQDLGYAREVISSLCSDEMAGRGYVEDGDAAAADYIKKQFELLNVQAFDYNYFQDFEFQVNTFPGTMELFMDGRKLVPGLHYIIDPASTGKSGDLKVLHLDSLGWDTLLSKPVKMYHLAAYSKMPVSSDKKFNERVSKVAFALFPLVVWVKPKLTWSVADYMVPGIQIDLVDSVAKDVPLKFRYTFESKFIKKHRSQNVLGLIHGTEDKEHYLVFTAHYDHLGKMGKEAVFRGANDNASGISMLLQMAKYFAENKPKCNVVFIAFAGEEAGLKGSEYYVQNPVFPLKSIRCLVNLDLLGTGEDGITVVNATEFPDLFEKLEKVNAENNYVTQIKKRGKAANSDHYYFSENGVPAFFIYTMGGIKAYHDVLDKPETLPLTDFADVFKLLRDFAVKISQ